MDLNRKLTEEHPLTAEEALRLDGALESARSQFVATLVSGLPDEAPSLEWRSQLNEKLARCSKRKRTVRYWRFGFGATAAMAVCAALVMMVRPDGGSQPIAPNRAVENVPQETVEDAILSGHEEMVSQASLGVSVAYHDSGS
jgi:hypothetical protein